MNKDHITLELDKVIRMLEKRCMSVLGKALASELTPATTLDNAKALVLQTEDAYTLISRFGSPSFDGVKNVAHSLARANAGGMLTMRELLDISSVLKCVHNVLDWRSHCENMNNSLDRYFEVLTDLPSLERKISSSILSEDEMHDNASPELFRIRRKIISAENKVRDKLDSIIRSDASKGCLQEAVVTIRNGRYVVPVKAEFRSHISGLIHDTSSSGSTVFIEPMGVALVAGESGICQGCGIATLSISYYDMGYAAGMMAYEILVNDADPATMEIQYASDLTKQYMADRCTALGITVPEDYVAIEAE